VNTLPANGAPVLVVDDDRDTVESTVFFLNYVGFRAIGACSSEMALKIARFRHPRAVLLDLAMPGQDGAQLARRLRQLPGMDDALLICISGYGRRQDRQLVLDAGCDYHMVKPVDPEELLGLLDRPRPTDERFEHAPCRGAQRKGFRRLDPTSLPG
jgi:DNA-binding response OmpR family regulator